MPSKEEDTELLSPMCVEANEPSERPDPDPNPVVEGAEHKWFDANKLKLGPDVPVFEASPTFEFLEAVFSDAREPRESPRPNL